MFPFLLYERGNENMLTITRKISAYNFYKGNTVKYIVIHDVGALGQALSNANYFSVERGASAHYFVDDTTIAQVVEDFNGAWHVGDGDNKYGINNQNSIGIEMCLTSAWKVSAATQNNTVDLVRSLKAKYPNAKIVRHYDASRKNCPGSMSANNWAEWNAFKLRLEGNSGTVAAPSVTSQGNTYTVAKGDTLYRISKNTGASVYNLQKLNGLSSSVITVGQVLKLTAATTVTIPVVAPVVVAPKPVVVSSAWVRESGTFRPFFTINVRSNPSTASTLVATYQAGDLVHYDSYMSDGTYTWIHYVSFSGADRYLVCRQSGTAWGSFS
jgi:N-acetylmuramoyl-L-alanine amidase CwlA